VRSRGILFRAALVAIAVLTVSGCSAGGSDSSHPAIGTAAGKLIAKEATATLAPAAVGQCWQISYGRYLQQPENQVASHVPCAAAHQAYTYAVVTLDASLFRASAVGPAFTACQVRYGTLFTHAGNEARVFISEILPSQARWDAGKRDVGCTVQTTKTGSLFQTPTFDDLPAFASFVRDVNSSPQKYSLCLDESGTNSSTGPSLGPQAVIADCSSAQWFHQPSPDFPDPVGEQYPGYDGLYPFMHAHCGALYDSPTVKGWIFYPNPGQWSTGDRSFQYWTGSR
jgi:hypothetical protein